MSRANQTDAGGSGRHTVEAELETLSCSSCGTEVPEGARSCPVCYRGVYRTCFCGWRLPANERTCPNCGADWGQSARVARKSRSRSPSTGKVLRHAALGAAAACAIALLIYIVLTGFARLAAPDPGAMPVSFGDRVALAVSGFAELFRRIGAFFARNGGTILSIIGIIVAGALAGVGYYLWHARHQDEHKKRKSRASRRVRRKKSR